MTIKRAKEIVGIMITHVFHEMGIQNNDSPPPESLKDLSLSTLIRANQMVIRANAEEAKTPFVEGKRTRQMTLTCDDRLIAALYTATHYHTSIDKCIVQVGENYLYNIHKRDVNIVDE